VTDRHDTPDEPLALSRLCVPFTPFLGRLEDAVVALVTTAGLRAPADPPFAADDGGYRVIAGTAPAASLVADHPRYDRACLDLDRNCLFPIDRLRELAAAGLVGGVTERHFAASFTPALRAFATGTAPRLARLVAAERPQAVVVTAGCRACHRTAAAVQRAVEMLGIPTVAITVEPEETGQAFAPRALWPVGFAPGQPLGPPGDAGLQRRILLDALGLLCGPPRPGEVVAAHYG
jgi:D-proline reductase (dithiol) PrdB